MEGFQVYRSSSVEWKPSPVVALATSPDGAQVAAAREDGSLEIWLVSPGSVGWHCQLTIHGDPRSRVSSLVWCRGSGSGDARLLSSGIDGSISEWDLFTLQQKVILDTVGVTIWQMAIEPIDDPLQCGKEVSQVLSNGYTDHAVYSDSESSKSDDDDDSKKFQDVTTKNGNQRLAVACDDGCLRIYIVFNKEGFDYSRSFPRISGRLLSVTWSLDAKLIFSGSSDGLIRCWDAISFHEVYRITVGFGGLGTGTELCVWSLLFLRCGALVSGDSNGSVQFWDSHHGTLLQAHTYHKGDVNALATVPSNSRVFSAGSDGQVILYKLSNDTPDSRNLGIDTSHISKWVYIGHVRAHTHDIRALTIAVPICSEAYSSPDEKDPKIRRTKKLINYTYHKWAHLGVPMLISAGDDTKLFAYSAREFTQFTPHDICPAPQRLSLQLVSNADGAKDGSKLMLVQHPDRLDFLRIKLNGEMAPSTSSIKNATVQLLAQIKIKKSRKIICSTISSNGSLAAFSDHAEPCLFELRSQKAGKTAWTLNKVLLPKRMPYALSMIFSADSSRLMLAGSDRKIYVVDLKRSHLLHTFVPRREDDMNSEPTEPPITRMVASSDGQWLAAINCYGDIYIFNMETQRQHWFISRFNGASVTAAGFPPANNNLLVITTTSNQVYVFDVEAKQLGEWSRRHTSVLPRRFQEFPGEVIGLSFPPSSSLTSVIIYSSRAMCLIDFALPVDQDDDLLPNGDQATEQHEFIKTEKGKRKRKHSYIEFKPNKKKNFRFSPFKDPVLFVRHLSENSLLVIEKRWLDVARSFDAPVHKHIYGT